MRLKVARVLGLTRLVNENVRGRHVTGTVSAQLVTVWPFRS